MALTSLNHNDLRLLREARQLFDRTTRRRVLHKKQARFQDRLIVHRFRLSPKVRQDKHRIFRILSRSIFGLWRHYHVMRKCIFYEIDANRNYYASRYEGNDFDGFCNQLRDNSVGGEDSLCILAACELFHVAFREMHDNESLVFSEIAPVKSRENERNPFYRKMIYSSDTEEHGKRLIRPQNRADDDIIDPNFQDKLSWLLANFENSENQAQVIKRCEDFLNHLPAKVSPKGQYRRHSLRIGEWNYKRCLMLGDGNCMPRSVGHHMFGTQHSHQRCRDMIVAKLKTNPDRYSKLRYYVKHPTKNRQENYEEYLLRMSLSRSWGDDAFMLAAADVCRIKITVLDAESDLFHEFVPMSKYYRKEIHCCQNSHHMDVLIPLQNFQQEIYENPFFDEHIDTFGLNILFDK